MWRRTVACVVALAGLLLSCPAGIAAAAPGNGQPPIDTSDGRIALTWDGPITALDWRSAGYAVAGDAFIGQSSMTVPGDRIQRTAQVQNAGPSDAHATVEIRDVSSNTPTGSVNGDLADCIHLFAVVNGQSYDASWQSAMAAAQGGISWQVTFPVAQGASFQMTVGTYFPLDETRGNDMGDPSEILSFGVQVIMVGDTTASGGSSSPQPDPSADPPAGPEVAAGPDGNGAPTGGFVASDRALASSAAVLSMMTLIVAGLWVRRRWRANAN
jgi:hypothetical protein